MKNIWIFNHYADPPDRQATRSYDLAKYLVNRGHKVTIFASSFNHYVLKEEKIFNNQYCIEENFDGVKFVWIKTFPYNKNDWRRALNIIEYGYKALWVGFRKEEKPDVMIGKVFHPLAPLVAYLLSRAKGSKFFFEVGDLWPQTLIDMGRLSPDHPVVFVLRVFEKFLYSRADKIITLLPYADEYIKSLGISTKKIIWIPNGVDYSRYEKIRSYDGRLSDPIRIMYIGGLTRSHAIDVILGGAALVQSKYPNRVKFIFVGGGTEKNDIIGLAEKLSLENVEFRASVPKSRIPGIMEEADAFIVALKNIPIYRYGISLNKMFDYLSSGRPILFSADVRGNPVEEAGAGITVSPEDPESLAKAVDRFMGLSVEERKKMGNNGIRYVKAHHDVKALAEKLESIL